MKANQPEFLEIADMQGIILRGYGELTAACYLLISIDNVQQAKNYLSVLVDTNTITPADKTKISAIQKTGDKITQAVQIAFTSQGITKLLGATMLNSFSHEFRQGMDHPYRAKLLGDTHENAPEHWCWGSENRVDMMLMCFARNTDELSALVASQTTIFQEYEMRLVRTLDTFDSPLAKRGKFFEHFGFRDGLSGPSLTGVPDAKPGSENQLTKAGEFVLGYKNEYDSFAPSPDKLGKNGTYMVFRQLEQKVFTFWNYMLTESREHDNSPEERAIRLGAKMVGRWPGGAPLAISEYDNPAHSEAANFSFEESDPRGYGCPFGAHIRRMNPRDMLQSGRTADQSLEITKKHQILRRGRIYGTPFVESMKPIDMLKIKQDDGIKRGLHFICLVADISKQFEFMQTVWANNFTFAGRCNEVDPLISPRSPKSEYPCVEFTVNDEPLRRNYNGIPQFTTMKGGAYFFVPGLRAIRSIADFTY